MSEARGGQEEPPCAQGQGRLPGGATACLRPGVVANRSYPASEVRGSGWEEQPHVQGAVAAQVQEDLEEPSHVEGQEGGGEEIPLIQSKEQWLCFAGAAVKGYPTPTVRETQVRW